MPAYLIAIYQERCKGCGRVATQKLYNERNAILGHYCKPCGETALRDFNRKHHQERPR